MWKVHINRSGGRRLAEPVVSEGAHLPCSHLSHRPGRILLTYCWKSETYCDQEKNLQNNFKLCIGWPLHQGVVRRRVWNEVGNGRGRLAKMLRKRSTVYLYLTWQDLQRCWGRGEKVIFTWLGMTCKDAHGEVNSLSLLGLTWLDLQRCSRPEVEFVHAVTAGGSVKFLPAV